MHSGSAPDDPKAKEMNCGGTMSDGRTFTQNVRHFPDNQDKTYENGEFFVITRMLCIKTETFYIKNGHL